MVIALGYDPQNAVSFIAGGARHIAQWLIAAQSNTQDFSGTHAFEPQLGPHEGHRTDLARNVDRLADRVGRSWALGPRHGANYTSLEARCRLVSHDRQIQA